MLFSVSLFFPFLKYYVLLFLSSTTRHAGLFSFQILLIIISITTVAEAVLKNIPAQRCERYDISTLTNPMYTDKCVSKSVPAHSHRVPFVVCWILSSGTRAVLSVYTINRHAQHYLPHSQYIPCINSSVRDCQIFVSESFSRNNSCRRLLTRRKLSTNTT